MCDYSLAVFRSRLAVEGEELVIHRFYTGSKGLAPPEDVRIAEQARSGPRKSFWEWLRGAFEDHPRHSVTAVCVPPGAELLLKGIPKEVQQLWRIQEQESVLFIQVSARENSYRDAVQFRQGRQVLLQNLPVGMFAQVLSLGGVELDDHRDNAARPFKPAGHFV